jgi:hypothetical protein
MTKVEIPGVGKRGPGVKVVNSMTYCMYVLVLIYSLL